MIKWYDEAHNAIVTYAPLPSSIDGTICLNGDGSFLIVINSAISEERQKRAYLHEIRHIENDDFYSYADVNDIERKTHEEGGSVC